jgi:hypothetical protein
MGEHNLVASPSPSAIASHLLCQVQAAFSQRVFLGSSAITIGKHLPDLPLDVPITRSGKQLTKSGSERCVTIRWRGLV